MCVGRRGGGVGGWVCARVCESLQEEDDKLEQQICSIIVVAKKTTTVTRAAAEEVVDLLRVLVSKILLFLFSSQMFCL